MSKAKYIYVLENAYSDTNMHFTSFKKAEKAVMLYIADLSEKVDIITFSKNRNVMYCSSYSGNQIARIKRRRLF